MIKYTATDIRNFALVGHGSTGKTSLAEALLFHSGATKRQGSVDNGSSHLDYDPQEKAHKYSIELSVASFDNGNCRFNLLDSPGHPDFIGQAYCALNAVETAVFVVCANNPVAANTRALWKEAGRLNLGRVIIINKMDAENVTFSGALNVLRQNFGDRVIPALVPEGEAGAFSAAHKVLVDNPEGLASEYRDALMEAIVEADDALMERFLNGTPPDSAALGSVFSKAIAAGTICPVLVCSATKGVGVDEVCEFFRKCLPSPAQSRRDFIKPGNDKPATLVCDSAGKVVGQVFKVVIDPYVGRIGYVRMYSGTLKTDSSHMLTGVAKPEKLSNFSHVIGKESSPIHDFFAGDIGAIAKCEALKIGQTIHDTDTPMCGEIHFPIPLVTMAVDPKNQADENKLGPALSRLSEADPCFKTERVRQTKELVVGGMSELHLQVQLERLKLRDKVEIETRLPRIPYLETIRGSAAGHHRHKKQTGGAGQFGEVYIKLEPLERGKGLEFVDAVVGGAIPHQFVPAVEKGIRELCEEGILSGNHIVDLKVTLYDGSHHSVDSKEIAFKTAARKALREAFMKAKPVLLEPMAHVDIVIPSAFMGAITSDISSRRGRVTRMDSDGHLQIIKAQIPLAEIQTYSTHLRSMTQGDGSYTFTISHYDVVPSAVAAPIIQAAQRKTVDDE